MAEIPSRSVVYPFPAGLAPSDLFEVEADGKPVFVHDCPLGGVATFEAGGPTTVRVRPLRGGSEPTVRPLSRGIVATALEGWLEIGIDGPEKLFLEFGSGVLPLHLFANPPENDRPDPSDPKVRYFAGGRVHETGSIRLGDGETLYLEGGAVVRGTVYAQGEGIRVAGPGLLDGDGLAYRSVQMLVFDGCRDLRVEGLTVVGTPSWMLVLGACERAVVENVKLIGWVVCSDGIDVVGSRDVVVRNCFLRNNDDCVAIKAVDYRKGEDHRTDWRQDVERVLVEGCTLQNDRAGNAMEIGFETQTESIRDITFRDIDVIAAHGEGGVFTIHNGDRATVLNVLYENIRVEHFYDKLIDFRILHSAYSRDIERGHIRDVTLRNVSTVTDRYHTVSLIGGYYAGHDIQGVTIENLTMGGRRVGSFDEIGGYVKHAEGVVVR
ncbi:hypothetical protein BH11ARM2_BH11ARM2_18930 [soil metagenome]